MNLFADIIQGPLQVLLFSVVLGAVALISIILHRTSGVRRYAKDDRRKAKPIDKFPINDGSQDSIIQDRRLLTDRRHTLQKNRFMKHVSIQCCPANSVRER